MANIYVIKNKCNDLMYVGQCTCDIKERLKNHIYDSNRTIPLHRAMDELGANNFYIELLDIVNDDIRLDTESYYIDKLNTLIPNGYNYYRHSSDGFTNKFHTKSSLEKMSISLKNWWDNASDDTKLKRANKISKKLIGKKFSKEHKKAISEFAKTRVGNKNPFYGKHHDDKTKECISNKNSKEVIQYDLNTGKELNKFKNCIEAGKYIKDCDITKAKQSSVIYRIQYTCQGNASHAYHYGWRYVK